MMSNNISSKEEVLNPEKSDNSSNLKSIRVFAPATVANVVCGFDVLGFAVNEPGDEVEMRLTETPGVVIKRITGDDGRLPLNAEKKYGERQRSALFTTH